MVWSNWQGAVGRGALVVVLIWSGLAWAQTPAQRPGDPADRIMVVHENGRKLRCRVEETWQLPDGRVAHLLQALETGEKITIVDDQTALLDPAVRNQKGMPKRIYAWGLGRKTPPEGSPIPPHLRSESGVVISQNTPGVQVAKTGKPGDVQVLDFQKSATTELKIAQVSGVQSQGSLQIIQAGDPNDKNATPIIQIGDALPPLPVPSLPNSMPSIPAAPTTDVAPAAVVPSIVPGAPIAPPINVAPTPVVPSAPVTPPTNVTPAPVVPNIMPSAPAAPTINVTPAPVVASTPAAPIASMTQAPAATAVNPSCCVEDSAIRRPWRPGDRVMDWLQNRNGSTVVTVTSPAPPIVGTVAQPVAPSNVVTGTTGSVANQSNIIIDKTPDASEQKPWRPGDRIVNLFNGKSQTSSTTVEPAKGDSVPPLPKAPDALKIQKIDDFLAQNNPAPEKKAQDKILKAPTGPFSTAMGAQPEAEKKDMWGVGAPDSVLPPSKSADAGKLPPVAQTRVNDPLTMPERFVDKRSGGPGPIGSGDMMPGDPSMAGYPLGSQSVLAARGGMLGQITYVPVPTVTVPQPFNPPLPPEPKMPSPPQLNTYVNAFTPPPQPKGTQEYTNQGMMPAQAMNPMMQQQMMMQQQAMYQQMMQQQAMNPNGYPPMPSQGPTMNFARQYQGPQAPNPFGPAPVMPAAYAPMPYPPMMPMQQPMQPVQQAGYQQPSAPAAQVDQLIKVLRESPYPAQREWAAQSLTSFEWKAHPHIVPNLLQSASQDPAASVRAGCVFCLGRMQAAVEPVFNTLNSMRNDIDPRVRQEVQQTLGRLGQPASN